MFFSAWTLFLSFWTIFTSVACHVQCSRRERKGRFFHFHTEKAKEKVKKLSVSVGDSEKSDTFASLMMG
jgi:hypothetical protein